MAADRTADGARAFKRIPRKKSVRPNAHGPIFLEELLPSRLRWGERVSYPMDITAQPPVQEAALCFGVGICHCATAFARRPGRIG